MKKFVNPRYRPSLYLPQGYFCKKKKKKTRSGVGKDLVLRLSFLERYRQKGITFRRATKNVLGLRHMGRMVRELIQGVPLII